jgi:glycosyltransferase involved in cell wall biosynthesis
VTRPARATFAVIIAAYQAADTIGETLESVLAQTRPASEVLVCDDGSTDDLVGALAPYRRHLTLVRQPNRGVSAAWNTLLWNASAEFAAFLDADDVFEPERLEAMAQLASERPELDVLATDGHIEEEGRVVARFNERNPFPAHDQDLEILRRCFMISPAVRLRRLLRVGGFDERLRFVPDWDGWLRVLADGARAGHVDEPLMRYRWRPDSLSDQRVYALRERVGMLEKARRTAGERERAVLDAELRRRRAAAALAEAEARLATGDVRGRLGLARAGLMRGLGPGERVRILRRAAGREPAAASGLRRPSPADG